jgi:opacity protein-like surface antigen
MKRTIPFLAVLFALGAAGPVGAQEAFEEDFPAQEFEEDVQTDEFGEEFTPEDAETVIVVPTTPQARPLPNIGVEIGGGVQSFTEGLGDVTSGGAGYSARAIFGPRSYLGLELGYMGAYNEAESTETLDNTTAAVYTNSGEALVRVNFFGNRSPVRPFIAGGVNYTYLDSEVSTPIGGFDLDGRDGIGFPAVAGIQFMPTDNFTVSARGNYTYLSNILDERLGNQYGGSLNIGALF